MSTTLKALQEIEQERNLHSKTKQRTDMHPLLPWQPTGAANPLPGRLLNLVFWGVLTGLVVAAGIAAAYGWFNAMPGSASRSGAVALPMPEPIDIPAQIGDGGRYPVAIPQNPTAPVADEPPYDILAASGDPPAIDVGRRTPSAVPESVPDIKPYTGGRLKVQAIAWGPEARQRMAVVNNRVVYIGDGSDGWVVSGIDQDAVIIEEGHTRWRVLLGR